jgi:hypothetical protein
VTAMTLILREGKRYQRAARNAKVQWYAGWRKLNSRAGIRARILARVVSSMVARWNLDTLIMAYFMGVVEVDMMYRYVI